MNIGFWLLQWLLAMMFAASGSMKLLRGRDAIVARRPRAWVRQFTAAQVRLIGLAELLGALGLVLPYILRTVPVLTPLAAAWLTVLMGAAVTAQWRRNEPVAAPALLGLLSLVVAVTSGLLGRPQLHVDIQR